MFLLFTAFSVLNFMSTYLTKSSAQFLGLPTNMMTSPQGAYYQAKHYLYRRCKKWTKDGIAYTFRNYVVCCCLQAHEVDAVHDQREIW